MGFSLGGILGGAASVINPVSLIANGAVLGGDIYSAYQNAQNVKDTNVANANIAAGQEAFSAQQAKQQMDFQERMSNTAHQREVTDLKAAGLNPLLSVNAGESTPSGAMGTSAGYASNVVPSVLGGFMNSAKDSLKTLQDLSESQSRINLNKTLEDKAVADAGLSRSSAQKQKFDADLSNYKASFLDSFVNSARSAWQGLKAWNGKLNVQKGDEPPFPSPEWNKWNEQQ